MIKVSKNRGRRTQEAVGHAEAGNGVAAAVN
jgi:hypothetical protein